MENYYLVNTLIAARATKLIVPFNRRATAKDTKLYRLKIGFFYIFSNVNQTRYYIWGLYTIIFAIKPLPIAYKSCKLNTLISAKYKALRN